MSTEELLIRLIRRFFSDNSPFYNPIIKLAGVISVVSGILLAAETYFADHAEILLPTWTEEVFKFALYSSMVSGFLLKFSVPEQQHPDYNPPKPNSQDDSQPTSQELPEPTDDSAIEDTFLPPLTPSNPVVEAVPPQPQLPEWVKDIDWSKLSKQRINEIRAYANQKK